MIILDTNILSEVIREEPHPSVLACLDRLENQPLFITAITVGELRFGIETMPSGKRRDALNSRIDTMLTREFSDTTLPFDAKAADLFGRLSATLRKKGTPIGIQDTMIAAITLQQQEATLITRNSKHFIPCDVPFINPFEE